MKKNFDLIVLGVGMAALNAANSCARAGWSVAVVDELPYGGACALRGCDPKKMLRRGAEIVEAARLMRGKGIKDEGLEIDWPGLVAFKRGFTSKMPVRIEESLKHRGVVTFHGQARFLNKDTVELTGGRQLQGRRILIATGCRPKRLEIPGAEHLIDSAQFMEMENLPKQILFVGGGYISFEFAHIAARAGSEVTIIDRGERPLKAFDPDLVDKLVERGRKAGVELHTQAALHSIEKLHSGFRTYVQSPAGIQAFSADLVVHGAGRAPAIDKLDLDTAGVEHNDRGIAVNEHLQSVSNAGVYAAGDVADTGGAPLTPVAVLEGRAAAFSMLGDGQAAPDYSGVPSVVFTIPELARVGLLESECRAMGDNVRVIYNDTGRWYSNLRIGESCASSKIIIDENTDQILGAHLLGPGYAELINFFSLAIKLNLTRADLRKMTAAYPTVGSDLGALL